MVERFEMDIRVRSYELDAASSAPPASFLRWFQEAAIHASAENGYDARRYRETNSAWYVRDFHLAISAHPAMGETIRLVTWVGDIEKITYLALRSNGGVLARAEADWVHVDRATGRPKRLDSETIAAFRPTGEYALSDRDWGSGCLAEPFPAGVQFYREHTVAWSELDGARHVNNAVYADWVQDDCAAHIPDREISRLRILYRRAAVLGDHLTRELAAGADGGWLHRTRKGDSTEANSVAVIQTAPRSADFGGSTPDA